MCFGLMRLCGRATAFIYITEECNWGIYCEMNCTGIVKFSCKNKVIFRTSWQWVLTGNDVCPPVLFEIIWKRSPCSREIKHCMYVPFTSTEMEGHSVFAKVLTKRAVNMCQRRKRTLISCSSIFSLYCAVNNWSVISDNNWQADTCTYC